MPSELDQQLEDAYRNRPVVYGFRMQGGRTLSVEEVTIIINNVSGYDRMKEKALGNCAIPGCGYPLYEDNIHYRSEYGNICSLCRDMIDIIRTHAWFLEMHRRWKQGFDKDNNGGTATEDRPRS